MKILVELLTSLFIHSFQILLTHSTPIYDWSFNAVLCHSLLRLLFSKLLFRVMTDLTVDTNQSDKAFIYELPEICNNIYNK